MNSMHKIGYEIPREDKTKLIVCGYTSDGKYLVRTKRPVTAPDRMSEIVDTSLLSPGVILQFPNGKQVIIISQRDTGYWETACNDLSVLTVEEVEILEAEANAVSVYSAVATKRESGGNSKNLRYLPRRMTNEPRE